MIIQVMSRKHGHQQYVLEHPDKKALKQQLSQIEELKEGHRPPHFLAVQMQGQMLEKLTMKQLENAKLDSVERILVAPIITAG